MSNTNKDMHGKQVNKVEDRRKSFREEIAIKEAMDLFDEQFNAVFKSSSQSVVQSAKSYK